MKPGKIAEKAATEAIDRIIQRDRETEQQWLDGQDIIAVAIECAIAEEREACAKLVENNACLDEECNATVCVLNKECAAEIRARGDK